MYRDYMTGEYIYTTREERQAASALDYYDERKAELDEKASALVSTMESNERLTDEQYNALCEYISDNEPSEPCFGDDYDDIERQLDSYEDAIADAMLEYIALVS